MNMKNIPTKSLVIKFIAVFFIMMLFCLIKKTAILESIRVYYRLLFYGNDCYNFSKLQ